MTIKLKLVPRPSIIARVIPWVRGVEQDDVVLKAGDTMTGNLIISKDNPALALDRTDAVAAEIKGRKDGLDRWTIWLGDSDTETGVGNSGSNFAIYSHNDAGGAILQPLVINRATGLGVVAGDPTADLGIVTKQYADTAPTNDTSTVIADGTKFYNPDAFGSPADGVVHRFNRVFVGAATLTSSDGPQSTPDWFPVTGGSQLTCTSALGMLGISGGSRTSDYYTWTGNHSGGSQGVSGLALNDDAAGDAIACGIFGYAYRDAGVGGITENELTCGNAGSTVDVTPWSGFPAGTVMGLNITCAWDTSSAYLNPVSCLLHLGAGTVNAARKGMIVQNNALSSAHGTGGNGVAIEMASGQSVRWLDSGSAVDAEIYGAASGLQCMQNFYACGDAQFGLTSTAGTRQLNFNNSWYFKFDTSTGDLDYWTPSAAYNLRSWANGDFTIRGSVGSKVGAGDWADSSDARIKTVVGDYPTGLDAIKQLLPKVYIYKGNDIIKPPPPQEGVAKPVIPSDEPNPASGHYQAAQDAKQFIGLVAQECETVMPELVTKVHGEIDGEPVTDLRMIDTTALVFALINAVKELSARVEQLEAAPP